MSSQKKASLPRRGRKVRAKPMLDSSPRLPLNTKGRLSMEAMMKRMFTCRVIGAESFTRIRPSHVHNPCSLGCFNPRFIDEGTEANRCQNLAQGHTSSGEAKI